MVDNVSYSFSNSSLRLLVGARDSSDVRPRSHQPAEPTTSYLANQEGLIIAIAQIYFLTCLTSQMTLGS